MLPHLILKRNFKTVSAQYSVALITIKANESEWFSRVVKYSMFSKK